MKNTSLSLFLFLTASLLTLNERTYAEISPEEFSSAMQKFASTEEGQKIIAKATQRYFERTKFGPTLDEQFASPINITIPTERPTLGSPEAPITISIFSDFECPFCKDSSDRLKQILKLYPDDVNVRFMNTPLPASVHPLADKLAIASIAAWKQGKFWEMHDAFFENQDKLSPEFIFKTASALDLDITKFSQDLRNPAAQSVINYDKNILEKIGVSSRPAMLISGPRGAILLRGSKPLEQIQEVVERWIKEIKQNQ